MFKKEDMQNVKNTETIIGESVIVEGDFNGHGNVVIEGKLKGSFMTDGHVLVGDHAEINANLKANSAFISGKVLGNIEINSSLDVAKTAIIKGDIQAGSIAVESGCEIEGHLSVSKKHAKEISEPQLDLKMKNNKKEELE
jgi:cytoskeletal protein CcmA (bactofilin family)